MRTGRRSKGRYLRTMLFGFMLGFGVVAGLSVLSENSRISALEKRLAGLETQAPAVIDKLRISDPAEAPVAEVAVDRPAIEVAGWFVDRIEPGPRGHYTVQPQLRNNTGREIQMVRAFLIFRTRTGDILCGMTLTQNMTIPAGGMVMEPQAHRVGWERLHQLNLSELRSRDIVADLQIEQVVFAN